MFCFNRHKSEISAKMLKETDTIRPLHKGSGLTKGIFLHHVQDIRECLKKALSQIISVNIYICFPMEEIEGKESSLLDNIQARIKIPRSPRGNRWFREKSLVLKCYESIHLVLIRNVHPGLLGGHDE